MHTGAIILPGQKTDVLDEQLLPNEKIVSEVQIKSSDTAQKVFDNPILQAAVLDLKGKLSDLTPIGQRCFHAAILQQIKTIAGLQGSIVFDNQRYQMESGRIAEPEVREKWRLVKEQEQGEMAEARLSYEAFKTIFMDRSNTLQTAIQNHQIEMAILQEVVTGQQSAWNLGAIKRAMACSGATYRLGESKAALEVRKRTLAIKQGDTAPEVELPKESTADSVAGKLVNLSNELASLKEETAVIYEALRVNAYEAAKKTEWPKKFFLYLMESLKNNRETIASLKTDVDVRLKAIESELSGNKELEPHTILSLKQEKAEITRRWESSLAHERETSDILGYLKKLFTLEEQEESIDFDDFSLISADAFNLLILITSHREQVVQGNTWESYAEINQRKAVYFRDVKQYERLVSQKATFEADKLAPRMKELMAAIQTYQGYIQTIQDGMQSTCNHLLSLDREAQVRAKWKVEAPNESPKKASPQIIEPKEDPSTTLENTVDTEK